MNDDCLSLSLSLSLCLSFLLSALRLICRLPASETEIGLSGGGEQHFKKEIIPQKYVDRGRPQKIDWLLAGDDGP